MNRLRIHVAISVVLSVGIVQGCSSRPHESLANPERSAYSVWLDGLSDAALDAEIARLQAELGVEAPSPHRAPPRPGRTAPRASYNAPTRTAAISTYRPPVYHLVSATAVGTYSLNSGFSGYSFARRSFPLTRNHHTGPNSRARRSRHVVRRSPRGGTRGTAGSISFSPGRGLTGRVVYRSGTLSLRASLGRPSSAPRRQARSGRSRR